MAIKFSVVQQKYNITGQNILKSFAKAQASGQPDDCRFLLSDEGRDIIVDLHLNAIKRIVKLSKENQQP
ncbi:MAG TPA: hypothetical protein VIK55_00620 [Paludibacter sp.]